MKINGWAVYVRLHRTVQGLYVLGLMYTFVKQFRVVLVSALLILPDGEYIVMLP